MLALSRAPLSKSGSLSKISEVVLALSLPFQANSKKVVQLQLRGRSGSFSLINVGVDFHCLHSFSFSLEVVQSQLTNHSRKPCLLTRGG